MGDCLFCKIINGDIPSNLEYESENIVAFRDINPQAPTHILIIPREHIETLNDVRNKQQGVLGEMQLAASKLAKKEEINIGGFRTVFNCNGDAGQSVFHIHLHLLGGRSLKWPPG